MVLAGGLTKHRQWRNSSKKFFIPVKVLAKKFRGKFLCALREYYRQNELQFFGQLLHYRQSALFRELFNQCYAKNWYIYTKRTFSGPLAVVRYLGRYTHRIAIANSRIVAMDENAVTIRVRDTRTSNQTKLLTVSGVEFIRRFLMHVLPKGFVKIRHYGLLANRNKQTKLALCKTLTNTPAYKPLFEGLNTIEILCLLMGKDITVCPACQQGKLQTVMTLLPSRASPA